MRWKLWTTIVAVAVAFSMLAAWQRHEYVQECSLAAEMLHRQSHSIMNALVGGIRTHRRRGRYFVEQLQGSLDGLAAAADVLAVGVADDEGRLFCSAGNVQLIQPAVGIKPGEFWDATGYRLVEELELAPVPNSFGGGSGPGRGRGGPSGLGDPAASSSPFSAGGRFLATLVLDRSPYDAYCRRAAWLRGTVVATGSLLLLGATLAWYVTLRAAGRARLLETEARHLRDLGQAAAGLAHETRNPLGLIRGWAQRLVQSGFESAEQQQQAESIVEECDRVTARINQFLAFARPPKPAWQAVRVLELLDELAIILEPDFNAGDVAFHRQSVPAEVTVQADRELLRQTLFNLLQNAVQASPTGGAVDVTLLTRQDGSRRIEVANSGAAVPADMVERLFTPYFTTRPGGTGLGLAIVRHIANVHGWEAGYLPRPGGGSLFWLDRLHG